MQKKILSPARVRTVDKIGIVASRLCDETVDELCWFVSVQAVFWTDLATALRWTREVSWGTAAATAVMP